LINELKDRFKFRNFREEDSVFTDDKSKQKKNEKKFLSKNHE